MCGVLEFEYRVHIRSVPGCYAQYDGHIDVQASSEKEAIEKAFYKLKNGAFPDRTRDMWKVDNVEKL